MIVVREGDTKPDSESWLSFLGIDSPVYEELVENGLLKKNANATIRWNFVGFVRIPHDLVVSLPGAPFGDLCSFHLIRACLNRYFSDSFTRKPLSDDLHNLVWRNSAALAEVDAALTLIRFISDNGPYLTVSRQKARRGKPDWRRTLQTTAYISESGPFYPVLHYSHYVHQSSDITRLQLTLAALMLRKYPILPTPAGLEDAIRLYGAFDPKVLTAQRDRLLAIIAAERSVTFRNDIILMLDVLLILIGSDQGLSGSASLKLYGTIAFEYVWEDICRALLGDDPNIRAQMPQPTWYFDNPQARFVGADQRPDIVFFHNGATMVIDAKYYYPIHGK